MVIEAPYTCECVQHWANDRKNDKEQKKERKKMKLTTTILAFASHASKN